MLLSLGMCTRSIVMGTFKSIKKITFHKNAIYVKILSTGTDRSEETVQTLIRLFL